MKFETLKLTALVRCLVCVCRLIDSLDVGAHPTHRIHWINTRIEDLRHQIEALGKEQFGDGFSLSVATLLKLKKYYHRLKKYCKHPMLQKHCHRLKKYCKHPMLHSPFFLL
jgi:hypothetical protein